MNGADLSEEEIQILLGNDTSEETVRMKCKDCGFEENAPKWVINEMAGIYPDEEPSNGCIKCNGTMYIK